VAYGLAASGILTVLVIVGSRRLAFIDPSLVGYLFATLFAAFGIAYRYAVWLRRPPTHVYWHRGWQMFLEPRRLGRNLLHFPRVLWDNILAQKFIEHRSALRWGMHFCLFWGCVLAALVTFPLVWGWIHFESRPDNQMIYRTFVFGFEVLDFRIHTLFSFLIFHALDWAALIVLTGIVLSLRRRFNDHGAIAVQQFGNDMLPLIMLFAICVTGLMLTVSYEFMEGRFYGLLALTHEVTVVFTLLYLPFGKFFHIFQRPAQLGIHFYRWAGEGEPARCRRCGQEYASAMQVEDLERVLPEVGFDYRMHAPVDHYQHICPACRRKVLALRQAEILGGVFTR
jgi:hypothetical protein